MLWKDDEIVVPDFDFSSSITQKMITQEERQRCMKHVARSLQREIDEEILWRLRLLSKEYSPSDV